MSPCFAPEVLFGILKEGRRSNDFSEQEKNQIEKIIYKKLIIKSHF